jgi:membrane protein
LIEKAFNKLINRAPILRWLWMKLKKLTLPGFEGVPVFEVILMFRKEIRNDAMSVRASAISFNFILALFPTSIFIFTLIPYIPIEGFSDTLLDYVQEIMPPTTFESLEATILDIINNPKGGWLSATFFLAFYFSINAIMNMMRAFDKANPTFKERNWFQKFFAAFKINILIILQLFLVIVLIILSQDQLVNILKRLGLWGDQQGALMLHFIRVLLTVFTFFNTIALIYYFAPAVKKKYRYFSVGATFATILLLLISYLISFYVKYLFGRLNGIYGSLSTMIFIMAWVYLNSFVLLFGFELNNSIAVSKNLGKSKK